MRSPHDPPSGGWNWCGRTIVLPVRTALLDGFNSAGAPAFLIAAEIREYRRSAPPTVYRALEFLLDHGLVHRISSAAPPTVYRALEFLHHGLVHRIQSLNAFVGCADPEHAHRGLFLICDACGDAVEIEDSAIDRAVAKSATQLGFTLKSRTIEATGLCRQCAPD